MATLAELLAIAKNSYRILPENRVFGSYKIVDTTMASELGYTGTGFLAHSYYSSQTNTLVVAFAGTDPLSIDLWTDAELALVGSSNQDKFAVEYASRLVDRFSDHPNGASMKIVFTGHSLGGYLAQVAALRHPNARVVALNSPGLRGVFGGGEVLERGEFFYSDPNTWYFLDSAIHSIGEIPPENVKFLLGSSGHGIDSLLDAVESGRLPITSEQWGAILAEGVRSGELSLNEVKLLGRVLGERFQEAVLPHFFKRNPECFLAGTPVTMANGETKPIENVRTGDWVMSYDAEGNLRPGRVARTFVNEVPHVLDVHGMMVTPGHATLCGDGAMAGQHVPIIDILCADAALVREDGTHVRAATNRKAGSIADWMVHAVTGELQPDGSLKVRQEGRIRAGTRYITDDGDDICVLDMIMRSGGTISREDGLIRFELNGPGTPFHWTFSDRLPRPEDYVLQRSGLTLEEILGTGERPAGAHTESTIGLNILH